MGINKKESVMSKSQPKKQKKPPASPKTKPVKDLAPKDTPQEEISAPMKAGLAAVAAMPPAPPKESKLGQLITLLKRPEGASIDDMVAATGWQKHTVRSALSHALAKKRGYLIVSDKPTNGHSVVSNTPTYGKRVYKIVDPV
jgi:hypothetical protein